MATNTSSSDAREKAGGTGEQTQPKRGFRGSLASAGERVRRAIAAGREKAEAPSDPLAAVTGTHPVAVAADGDAGRPSVRALARALLHQDRTGAPLELDETESADAELELDVQADEPKTTPRAKSVPPPLPKQRVNEEDAPALEGEELAARGTSPDAELASRAFAGVAAQTQHVVEAAPAARVEAAAPTPAPAPNSRSAQLRARLAAAKAQLAQTQARLVEAAAPVVESVAAADEVAASEELEGVGAAPEESSNVLATAAQQTVAESDAAETAVDNLDEFEDLDATALVEEPAPVSDAAN